MSLAGTPLADQVTLQDPVEVADVLVIPRPSNRFGGLVRGGIRSPHLTLRIPSWGCPISRNTNWVPLSLFLVAVNLRDLRRRQLDLAAWG